MDTLSPNIRRLVAQNPSAFTFYGTNTYILGTGRVAVVDPGPAMPDHIDALVKALTDQGEEVTHIFVTHTHKDHSPGVALLKNHFSAPCFAYGPHGSGALESGVVVEEGGDMDFRPDILVKDGDLIEGDGWSVECVYTPGHTSNHMCYSLTGEQALFTGDHIMGWSTSVIVPPDGHMGKYMASLQRLLERKDRIYWPAHGPAILDPEEHVQNFIDHRIGREKSILQLMRAGNNSIRDIVEVIYKDHPRSLHPAASLSVFASVIRLMEDGLIGCSDQRAKLSSKYHLLNERMDTNSS